MHQGEEAQINGLGSHRINFSAVDGWTGQFGGAGNIDADPQFIDADGPDNQLGTADDNLRLAPGSPCIDAADNSRYPGPDHDADGNPRFVDDPDTVDTGRGTPPIIDMGGYEFQLTPACLDLTIENLLDGFLGGIDIDAEVEEVAHEHLGCMLGVERSGLEHVEAFDDQDIGLFDGLALVADDVIDGV